MRLILAPLALAAASGALAAPRAFSGAESEQLRCIAVLAIVAHEQNRPGGDYADHPQVADRGAHFAEVAGQKIARDSQRSRESVRDTILAEVAAFQKAYPGDAQIPDETIAKCIALMDRIDPPPPPPDIVHCAALIGLAQGEMQRREGMSTITSKLAVYAALLAGQAREKLRAEGKTENESDIVIGLAREAILADTAKRQAAGEGAEQDFEACFALANPPKQAHSDMSHR